MKILSSHSSTHYSALSFAIGAFISIIPTPVFGVFIGIGLTMIFKKLDKVSLIIAFVVLNPIFISPLYAVGFFIGKITFGAEPITHFANQTINNILTYSKDFLFGITVVSFICSIISYFVVRSMVGKMKEKRKDRLAIQPINS